MEEVLQSGNDVRIYNGNDTGVNEYPWQALLLVAGRPICGGQ